VPDVWNDPERAQALGRERSALEKVVEVLDEVGTGLDEAAELLEMAREEDDEATMTEVATDLERMEQRPTPAMRSSTSRPDPAAPRRRTGPRCCCACTCAGASGAASRPS
jgi:protein subunit release factor A